MRSGWVLIGAFTAMGLLLASGARADVVVASFADDLRPTTPAPGWAYLWNSRGVIGNPANYTSLLPTGDPIYYYDVDGHPDRPDPSPAAWVLIGRVPDYGFNPNFAGLPGGHPGRGYADPGSGGIERYAIAAYTLGAAGLYSITNSALTDAGASGDGLHVGVYVGTNATPLLTAATTALNSPVPFNGSLGALQAGDTIYVAVGAGATDLRDTFALRFQITAVPEPSSLALATMGVLGALGYWLRQARRAGH